MPVIRYDEVSSAIKSAIGKFVIITIQVKYSPLEVDIYSFNIWRACQKVNDVACNQGIGFFLYLFSIFTQDIITDQ